MTEFDRNFGEAYFKCNKTYRSIYQELSNELFHRTGIRIELFDITEKL